MEETLQGAPGAEGASEAGAMAAGANAGVRTASASAAAASAPGTRAANRTAPLVSFVVPVYNVAPYLGECLQSLCDQTLCAQDAHAIEVVCVNDGSSDNSAEVLAAWQAQHDNVRVITQKNSGVGHARNEGLAAATGKYVCFVDGDDYLDINTAEYLTSLAQREDADVVVFGAQSFPRKVKWVYEMFGPRETVRRDNGADIVLSERGCIPSAANKLYRRSLLAENSLHFNEDLVLGEDTSLQFLIFPLAKCVAFTPQRFYHYRFDRAGSAVTEGFKDHADQMRKHLSAFCYMADEWLARGYMAGRQGAFLEAIAFIFYDAMEMPAAALQAFAESFAPEFRARFNEADLKGIYPVERWLYQLLLALGAPNATAASRRKAQATYQRNMAAYKAARSCKHAVKHLVKGKEEWEVEDAADTAASPASAAVPAASPTSAAAEAAIEATSPASTTTPAVSVLVPICNVERYLPECLNSLAAQTLKEIEVICIDDGSSDSSGAIADKYAARYANFRVVHKPNSGYGHSMNQGLSLARGEYVGIVESDDFAARDMFAALYRIAKRHNLDVVKSSYFEHSEAGDVRVAPYHGLPYGRVIDPLAHPALFGTTPAIWSGLYKRSFLEGANIRFVESPGASFQDTGFIYKVWAAATRCMLLRRAWLHYRVDNAGSSVKSSKKVYALCDEHASVAQFLKTLSGERAKTVAQAMQQAKLGTYRWNYNRIAPEFHLEFAQRVAAEFAAANKAGLLVESTFNPGNWATLQQLLASPDNFCARYPEEIPWEF